jgi:hypothetical protein
VLPQIALPEEGERVREKIRTREKEEGGRKYLSRKESAKTHPWFFPIVKKEIRNQWNQCPIEYIIGNKWIRICIKYWKPVSYFWQYNILKRPKIDEIK